MPAVKNNIDHAPVRKIKRGEEITAAWLNTIVSALRAIGEQKKLSPKFASHEETIVEGSRRPFEIAAAVMRNEDGSPKSLTVSVNGGYVSKMPAFSGSGEPVTSENRFFGGRVFAELAPLLNYKIVIRMRAESSVVETDPDVVFISRQTYFDFFKLGIEIREGTSRAYDEILLGTLRFDAQKDEFEIDQIAHGNLQFAELNYASFFEET